MTQNKIVLEEEHFDNENLEQSEDLFHNVKYICNSTSLITESLQKGFDIVQMPNGDVIVTEIKVVNIQYSWDKNKERMVKIGQN